MAKSIEELKEMKQLYQNVFETADGKRVLAELSKICFGERTTFNDNPQILAFHEGQRAVILHIKNFMNIDIKKTEEQMQVQEKENADNVQ